MTPTNDQITAAARALSNDNAAVCNVNREDNWNFYGDSFRETARVALEAAMGVAPAVDPRTLHAMAGDMRAEQTFLGSCRESCDDSGKVRWDRVQRVIDYLDSAALSAKSEAAAGKPEAIDKWLHIDDVKGLCRDFSSRTGSVYIKDVESALDGLEAFYTAPPAASGQKLTCVECKGTGMRDSGGFQPWGESIEVPCECQRIDSSGQKPNDTCSASKQGSVNGNDPADCDWPFCGCDERATKVIAALQECDLLKDRVSDTPSLTDEQREALKHLIARGSSFPDHNGASGSVSRVDYRHLQVAAKVLSALLAASDSQGGAA